MSYSNSRAGVPSGDPSSVYINYLDTATLSNAPRQSTTVPSSMVVSPLSFRDQQESKLQIYGVVQADSEIYGRCELITYIQQVIYRVNETQRVR